MPAALSGGTAMLVLSRRVGEAIVIDDTIRITILEVRGDRVRVGIAAPPTVTVDRLEIHQRRAELAADLPRQAVLAEQP